MDIEITKLETACLVLAKAIEEGRIEGIQNEVREILNYNLLKKKPKRAGWMNKFIIKAIREIHPKDLGTKTRKLEETLEKYFQWIYQEGITEGMKIEESLNK